MRVIICLFVFLIGCAAEAAPAFEGHVHVEGQDVTFTGDDLIALHLDLTEEFALDPRCLSSGLVFVPEDDAGFAQWCGDSLAVAACYYTGAQFGVPIVNYVMVVRWDFYRNAADPDYRWVYRHEAGHHISGCLYGDTDAAHADTELWETIENERPRL